MSLRLGLSSMVKYGIFIKSKQIKKLIYQPSDHLYKFLIELLP